MDVLVWEGCPGPLSGPGAHPLTVPRAKPKGPRARMLIGISAASLAQGTRAAPSAAGFVINEAQALQGSEEGQGLCTEVPIQGVRLDPLPKPMP